MIDWLACALVSVISGVLCLLPPSVAVWCGRRAGGLAYALQPKRARIGVRNLRAAFDGQLTPGQAQRIIHESYRQLGAGMVELLRLPVFDIAYFTRYVTVEGLHHIEAAAASGQGVVFLTGHYGNWELSSIVAAFLGHPIVALARAQDQFPRLYRLLVSYRESKGCIVVHKGGAMKRLIATLEAKGFVGIVADQASRQGMFVEFFGRPAQFATGPFELAYTRHAIILPAFNHRVRGPHHRVVIEPPLVLDRSVDREAAVRQGIKRFADILARHIREDPSQWLWMHKRWKRTPARRVLVLSDGKTGHLKQSLAVVEALRDQRTDVTSDVIEIRYRGPWARALAMAWSGWVPGGLGAARCLQWTLAPQAARVLLRRYADLIVSCGAATAPVNRLWSLVNGAKSVVVMNPAPLPLSRFDLVIAPAHDRLPIRRNVVRTTGAPSWVREEDLQRAQQRLRAHPRFQGWPAEPHGTPAHPVIGVFIGGDTDAYTVEARFTQTVLQGVLSACETLDGWCLVTTSRRTASAVESTLTSQLNEAPRCRLLLIASRDPLDGTMEGMLGACDMAVVTGESISMVSEACASGRRVIVVEPPRRRSGGHTKHHRFLQGLQQAHHIELASVTDLRDAVQRLLRQPPPATRFDNVAPARDALSRLL